MTIIAALHHLTRYRYDRPVELGPQVIRLRPAPHSRTAVPGYSLKITPANHFINWQQDPFGNWLARLVFPEKAREFSVEVDLKAEMTVINPFDFFIEGYAESLPFAYAPELEAELAPYLAVEDAGPALDAFVASLPREHPSTVNFLVELNARLQREVRYVVRMEAGVQTPDETLALASGSCRDSAWLLVQVVRRLGLAARFVSGYLIQLQARHRGAATARCGTPGRLHRPARLGRGLSARRRLDRLRRHLGPADRRGPHPARRHPALPLRRADHRRLCEPAKVDFHFEMDVTRLVEPVRITKPFEDDRWEALDALGEQVDRRPGRPGRAADHGRRADLRARSTTSRPPNGTPTPSGPTKRGDGRRADPPAARRASRRAACCTTARASGIRASPCRAGRFACSGAATASRSGPTRR